MTIAMQTMPMSKPAAPPKANWPTEKVEPAALAVPAAAALALVPAVLSACQKH